MKAIPRLIAGTAVVLAAVLTTAPVTAGIADFFLNPGTHPTKRAAPALTGSSTASVAAVKTREDNRTDDEQPSGEQWTGRAESESQRQSEDDRSETAGTDSTSTAEHRAGLVAHTDADAQARVSELAGDLQAGVDAGEYSQSDADRVLGDLSSYIRGERTWPERSHL